MEFFHRSKSFNEEGKPIRGYKKRMFREQRERGMSESTDQRVCDQVKAIRKNGWLSKLELEGLKKQVEDKSQGELSREKDVTVESEAVETDVGTFEEEKNDAEDGISNAEGDFNEEHRAIV